MPLPRSQVHQSPLQRFVTVRVRRLVGVLKAIFVVAVVFAGNAESAESNTVNIPELAWEERSDWINVKTAGEIKAVADGRQDDTAAIQAALDRMQEGTTIYFPPGTYKITKTLVIPLGRFLGVTLIGHGRTTHLVWDGEAKGRMFWTQDGLPYSRFVGFTWDGRGKAAVGIDHSCLKLFETEVRHQHEAFLNFAEAGIRVGHEKKVATAETVYENCLFERCKKGAHLLGFNVLDHTFEGCEFRECEHGVYAAKGTNCYVRNCHFDQSKVCDIVIAGEQGSSVRRCSSYGSKQFLDFASSVGPLTIQDCQVEAWTNSDCAVHLNGAPVLIFDCGFTKAPAKTAPVKISNIHQRIITSNNHLPDDMPLVKQAGNPVVVTLPSSSRGGVIKSGRQSFLKRQWRIPGKVFDAKRDFGAKGDFMTDDTVAITKTIEAARAHGQGALAYFPTGKYVVKETLKLTGSDYFLGGSGMRTAILWRGKVGGTTVEIRDPDQLTIENISIGFIEPETSNNTVDGQQIGTGKPSSMAYDRVWVWGMYQRKPLEHGLQLLNLGKADRVIFHEINGNLRFTDSADATVLLRLSYEGTVLVEGKSLARDGFIGGCVRLGTQTDPALWLKDNQSFVMSDFYIEQSTHAVRMEGDVQLPSGRATLQGAKFELNFPQNNGVEIENYRGELTMGPYQFYTGNPIHRFVQKGETPFALTLLGCLFYSSQPEFKIGPTSKLGALGISTVNLKSNDTIAPDAKGLADTTDPESPPRAVNGLDDLRRLGELDISLNYPE